MPEINNYRKQMRMLENILETIAEANSNRKEKKWMPSVRNAKAIFSQINPKKKRIKTPSPTIVLERRNSKRLQNQKTEKQNRQMNNINSKKVDKKGLTEKDSTPKNTSWKAIPVAHTLLVISLLACINAVVGCSPRKKTQPSAVEARISRLKNLQTFKLIEHQKLEIKSKAASAPKITIGYSSIILNPSKIDINLYSGWNREYQANKDTNAIAFISGPTFEVTPNQGMGFTVDGDLKLANGYWESKNHAASSSRASLCILNSGISNFGYGSLKDSTHQDCRIFIGGLHSLTNHTQRPPSTYKGVYGRMNMADVRIIYALRKDNLLEIVETDDGVYFDDLKEFIEAKGFLAAFVPDHASKSRLIIPQKRLWSAEKAIWVSGGRPSITQMPIMLKITARKRTAESGN